jgi:hypothetical protein
LDTPAGHRDKVMTLTHVVYAKNAAQERFILKQFSGQLKGRYVIAFLVGIEYLGGKQLRRAIELELGDPRYGLDAWVSGRDLIYIFDRAARAGVSMERMGEILVPAYKRANPEEFEGKTVHDGADILERAYRLATTYGGVSPAHEMSGNNIRVYRVNSPMPCLYFAGVIKGLLQTFSLLGTVREVTCQWEGAKSCCFEACWGGG